MRYEEGILEEEPKEVTLKYEEGLSETFDKLPIWLRWIVALPASLLGYTLLYFITYISWYWYSGDMFTNGFVGQTYRDAIAVAVPLYIIHECVPRFKFIISTVIAGVYVVLGVSVLAIAIYVRPIDMNLDYFFINMLPGIVTVAVAIIMIVTFVKHKFNLGD